MIGGAVAMATIDATIIVPIMVMQSVTMTRAIERALLIAPMAAMVTVDGDDHHGRGRHHESA